MTKWADFGITEVRYNSAHTHIDRVKIRPDNGDTVGEPSEYSRQYIVDAIEEGTTFVTIIEENDDGKWEKGQPVHIITVNQAKYIKTVDNGKESDNLENLPEF